MFSNTRPEEAAAQASVGPDDPWFTLGREGAPLQRKAAGNTAAGAPPPPPADFRSADAGRPLDLHLRQRLEPRFGHDFGDVRVFTDESAQNSADGLHARAYTMGPNIVFGPGQYQPGTSAGQRLLAHELTHVVQQARFPAPAVAQTASLEVSQPGDAAETEAQSLAEQIVAGGDNEQAEPLPVQAAPRAPVSRSAWEWLKNTASGAVGQVQNVASGAVSGVQNVAARTWNNASNLASRATGAVSNTASRAWNGVKQTAAGAWNGAKRAASSVTNTASGAWNRVRRTAGNVVNTAHSTATRAWNGARQTASGAWNRAQQVAGSGARYVRNAAARTWHGAQSTAKEASHNAQNTATEAWHGIQDTAGSAWHRLQEDSVNHVAPMRNAHGPWEMLQAGWEMNGSARKLASGYIKNGEEAIGQGIDWLEDKNHDVYQWAADKTKGVPVLEQVANAGVHVSDFGTQLVGGVLKGATGLVGGVANMAVNPVDTLKGLATMNEHLPGTGILSKGLHGLYNVATGQESMADLRKRMDPLQSMQDDAAFWKTVGSGLIEPYKEAWNKGKYGEIAGRGAFDIVTTIGTDGVGALGKGMSKMTGLGKTVNAVSEAEKAASITQKVEQTANAASNVEKTASATSKIEQTAKATDEATNVVRKTDKGVMEEMLPDKGPAQEYVPDLTHVTGKGGKARNQAIEAILKEDFPNLDLRHTPEYNPFIRTGVAREGAGTQIGKNRFSSRKDLRDTVVHEELHHRWWEKGRMSPHHSREYVPSERFYDVIKRYKRRRGWLE